MTEIVLTAVIGILCILIAYLENSNRKERKSLVNAIKAKDASDLANLEMADKTEIKVAAPQEPDLTPIDQVSDEDFDTIINDKL